jgi:hypothetical protein
MGTVMHPVESATICQDWSVPIQFYQTLFAPVHSVPIDFHQKLSKLVSIHWNPSEKVQTDQYPLPSQLSQNLSVPINPFTSRLNWSVPFNHSLESFHAGLYPLKGQ